MEFSVKKVVKWIIKSRLRYPRIKSRISSFTEPNLCQGLTDHPLDQNGAPIYDLLAVVRKILARKTTSILHVELLQNSGCSFTFRAWGYDALRQRDLTADHLVYKTGPNVKCVACTLQLDILTPSVYRLRLVEGDNVPEHITPMIDPEEVPGFQDAHESAGKDNSNRFRVDFQETSEKYHIKTPCLTLVVWRDQFRIQVLDAKGKVITETGTRTDNEFASAADVFPLGFIKNRKPKRTYGVENFTLHPGEAIYGLGEKFGPINRVGQTVCIWNTEGMGNTSNRAYKHIPFFLSSRGYGVFFNECAPMTFWVGSREVTRIFVAAETELVDYFFFYGPDPRQVLEYYTAITGRARIPPRWSFGTWVSRISYKTQEEVLQTARRLRDEKFPSDVINIDTNWFANDWACDWQFDPIRFPDPVAMFRECAQMGFKICLWQMPYVLDQLAIQKDAKARGALAKNHGPFIFSIGGPAKVIDFSRQEGVQWYQEKLSSLFEQGARVIKVDFGEQVEPHQEFLNYDGRQMHNLFPLLYNKAAFDITETHFGKGNAVIWARSAYAGSQRYPLHWSGDNSSTFPNMIASLRGGLSLGLCGFTYWSQDTGGFMGIPSDELYARWTALSVFQSHFRYHGAGPRFKEPWNYTAETQAVVRRWLEFRYRLIPYLFSEGIKAAKRGLPLIRPMFMEFPKDPVCYHIEDQFFSGEHLLVAPVYSLDPERQVYLPPGRWYDFWSGEIVEGASWMTSRSPLDQIPLFIRTGVIIPLGDVTQHIPDELPPHLTLCVYPDDDRRARYRLFDEQGHLDFSGKMDAGEFPVTTTASDQNRKIPKLTVSISPIMQESGNQA